MTSTNALAGTALIAFACVFFIIYRGKRQASIPDRLVAAAAPLMVFLIAMTAVTKMFRQPFLPWSHNRLTPAIALLHGCGCPGAPDHGAILSWMYGPLAFIAYLPAAILSSPTAIILAAGFLTTLFYCVPLALAAGSGADGTTAAGRSAGAIASFFTVFFMSAALPALAGPQFNIHADAPSLGLAGAACVALARRSRVGAAASAVLLACAIFTKQNTLPLLLALPLYALAVHGAKAALRWSAAAAAALLCLTAASHWVCGPAGGLLSMLGQPLGYPWVALSGGTYTESPLIAGAAASARLKTLGIAGMELFVFALPFIAVLLLGRLHSGPAKQSPRLSVVARLAGWLKNTEWSVYGLAALSTIPVALLSRVKIGGYFNSFAVTLYFLALAAAVVLAKIFNAEKPLSRAAGLVSAGVKTAAVLLALIISFVTVKNVAPHLAQLAGGMKDNPVEQAYRFARAHPGQAYFPHFPLSTLMADGRLYHSAYGLWERRQAGVRVDTARFRTAVPPDMRFVCFHRDSRWDKSDVVEGLAADLGYTRPIACSGMGEWTIFTR